MNTFNFTPYPDQLSTGNGIVLVGKLGNNGNVVVAFASVTATRHNMRARAQEIQNGQMKWGRANADGSRTGRAAVCDQYESLVYAEIPVDGDGDAAELRDVLARTICLTN